MLIMNDAGAGDADDAVINGHSGSLHFFLGVIFCFVCQTNNQPNSVTAASRSPPPNISIISTPPSLDPPPLHQYCCCCYYYYCYCYCYFYYCCYYCYYCYQHTGSTSSPIQTEEYSIDQPLTPTFLLAAPSQHRTLELSPPPLSFPSSPVPSLVPCPLAHSFSPAR